jgi:hypothetical protein
MGVLKIFFSIVLLVGPAVAYIKLMQTKAAINLIGAIMDGFRYQDPKSMFLYYTGGAVAINSLSIPFPYVDLLWLRTCPGFINLAYLMFTRLLGGIIAWCLFWLVTPVRNHNTKDFFFVAPFYNMIRA